MQLHSYSNCFKWFYDWNYSLVLKSCALRHLNVLSLYLQYRPFCAARSRDPWRMKHTPPGFWKLPGFERFLRRHLNPLHSWTVNTFLYSVRTVPTACITLCCYGDYRACPGRFSGCKTNVTVVAQLYGRHFGLCSASFETACPFWNSVSVSSTLCARLRV